MDKQITQIVDGTQQEVTTTITHEDGLFDVEIRACSALDDELRESFHDYMDTLGNESITVRSETTRSNQGNELAQTVRLKFSYEDRIRALDIIDNIIGMGKEDYQRQLERELARVQEGDSSLRKARQQIYFEDDAVEEFCLLFRGKVDV